MFRVNISLVDFGTAAEISAKYNADCLAEEKAQAEIARAKEAQAKAGQEYYLDNEN